IFVKYNQPDRVSLARCQIGKRRREKAAVIEFCDTARPVAHGRAGVEKNKQLRIRFAAESLEIDTVRAGENIPIDMAEIVAFDILTIFRELLAEAERWRAMQSRNEAI